MYSYEKFFGNIEIFGINHLCYEDSNQIKIQYLQQNENKKFGNMYLLRVPIGTYFSVYIVYLCWYSCDKFTKNINTFGIKQMS